MIEEIMHPKKTDKGPWKMFFVGLIFASLSLLLVHWFFSNDPDLSKASGIMVVLFCIMFTLPYMYFIIKREEKGLKFIILKPVLCFKEEKLLKN